MKPPQLFVAGQEVGIRSGHGFIMAAVTMWAKGGWYGANILVDAAYCNVIRTVSSVPSRTVKRVRPA